MAAYAELHCHTHFSFLDGASAPDELVERAVELGLSGLAVTDHDGLYGVVRFAAAAQEAGLRPVIGVEIELLDAAAPDPAGVVVPPRRGRGGGHGAASSHSPEPLVGEGPAGSAAPGSSSVCRAIARPAGRTCAAWARLSAARTWSCWPATPPAIGASAAS